MLVLMPSAVAACADLNVLLDSAEADLEDLRMEDARAGLEAIEVALTCGAPASAKQLTRMYQIQGVAAVVDDDTATASDAFSALHRIDPEGYRDDFGSAARQAYQEASLQPAPLAIIEIEPKFGDNRAYLDGASAKAYNNTVAGLHIVQLANPEGEVVFGELFFLAPDQHRVLDTGVPPAKVIVEPPPPVVVPKEPFRLKGKGWLAVSGVAAAAGAGAGLAAFSQKARFAKSTRLSDLDAAYTQQQVLAGAGYGLLGVSAVTLSVFVAKQF